MTTRVTAIGLLVAALVLGGRAADARQVPQPTGALRLLFDQGRSQFESFQFDQALEIFNQIVDTMTAAGEVSDPDLLVQVYDLRARTRFSLGDSIGAEQDYSALLAIEPSFRIDAETSPRYAAVLDAVRAVTIGVVELSVSPAGEVQIDGRSYDVPDLPMTIDLVAGQHQLTVNRPGFAPVDQFFTVTAAESVPLTVALERVSATLTLVTIPGDVEVLLDGTSRGRTPVGRTPEGPSGPLALENLPLGSHRLQLQRDCYVTIDQTVTLRDDIETTPLQLDPAVATVQLLAVEPGAAVFVDGTERGRTLSEVVVCEGEHVLEVRGAHGRFVDRRVWAAGDAEALTVSMRSAFPIVEIESTPGVPASQLASEVEGALAGAAGVLLYAPVASELADAIRQANVPEAWFLGSVRDAAGGAGLPPEVLRGLSARLAERLGVQGIAAVAPGGQSFEVSVWLLAAGSGVPDVVTFSTADPASARRAAERLGAPLPPILRPSLQTAVVDLAGVEGAVVIRPGGAGAEAGLAASDVIVGTTTREVHSVADLRAAVAAVDPAVGRLSLVVRDEAGATRQVDVSVAMVIDTVPMRDPRILYNRALLDLQATLREAVTPNERSAAALNLAIVQMQLGNWEDALGSLGEAQLPDGPGVSAGTVAYLRALCLEATGRTADAAAAYAEAAQASSARLGAEGPLVAPLARAKAGG